MSRLGALIRQQRGLQNVKQRQVSQLTGIPQPMISAIENGKVEVSPAEFERILAAIEEIAGSRPTQVTT